MDVRSNQRLSTSSTMTSQHHLHLIVTQNCQNLIYPCWFNRERMLSHVHRHHWKVIKHFFMSNMDVMSKQLWSTASTMRSQHHLHLHSTVTQNRQQMLTQVCYCTRIRVDVYAHRHHWKVLKHFICVQYGCEKQSKVVYSLNNDITKSFI